MTMERVRVEEFKNQMYKIVDESVLLFSRVYLSKFSLEALHCVGIRVFMIGYKKEYEQSFFCKTGALASDLWLEWVASSNCQLTEMSDCTFCPVVIKLSWPFNFLHAPHVWHFWRVTTHESVARVLLMYTLDQIFTLSHTQPLHNSHLNTGF